MTHKFFSQNPVKYMKTTIENSNVILKIEYQRLKIKINGCKSVDILKELMFEVLSLIFLYLGGYPQIVSLVINFEEQDITKLIVKFNTRKEFMRPEMSISNIDSATINETIIQSFREISQKPISSLQYLVCEDYKYVVADHKITLLLHVMEGLADRSLLKGLEKELQGIIGTQDTIGKFKASTFSVFKDHFFKYQREYKCDIFHLLQIDEMEFLGIITDTRNWNSHFLDEHKKPDRLKGGNEIIIYFFIIFFAIRIYIVDRLQVTLDEEKIKEYCFMIHDWILTEKLGKNEPLKSKTYNSNIIKRALKEVILRT